MSLSAHRINLQHLPLFKVFQHTYMCSAKIDVWIRNFDMDYGTAVKTACCGNELLKRSMRCDKMGG